MHLRPTLSDVARISGVSIATASRALSNPNLVAEDTRQSVRDAAESCGYTINLVARSLRMQRTNTILVLVPCIDNPFYPAIVSGAEEYAHDHGFSIILGFTAKTSESRRAYSDLLSNGRVDGVVILDGGTDTTRLTGPRPGVPAVQVLEPVHAAPVATVRVDDRHIAELAVRHLAGLGHRRIAHIAGDPQLLSAKLRREGYAAALAVLGLPVNESLVRPGHYQREAGATAMASLLDQTDPPTAVFCANDASACGAMQVCRERTLRIPQDISIIGVDGTEDGEFHTPPLTTIRLPRRDIGMQAMAKLIGLIHGQPGIPAETVLPVELVVRGTTAAPRA